MGAIRDKSLPNLFSSLNIPVICSNCKSGRKEFIDDNKRGYLFETNSIGSFVKTFQRFLNEDKKILRKKTRKKI